MWQTSCGSKPATPCACSTAATASGCARSRKPASAGLQRHLRRQTAEPRQPPDIDYLFAPLKHARLDYMAQKATEMGVRRLRPVFTERTVAQRVNLERLKANAIEAAEQCNLVAVPEVLPPETLDTSLANWDPARRLIFCDEAAAMPIPSPP
jgi:16S rRNA (uracil1498-N3)-methyltransferase